MILAPLLVDYGMRPQCASATSSLTVVFSSFISLSLSIIGGFLEIDQVIWFFILSLLGAVMVSSILNYLVLKFNRQSIILFTLVIVITASLIVVIIFSGLRVMKNPNGHLHFRPICEQSRSSPF
eukprot:TRINITY_DN19512_c0_g1_i2.p1 TRINITY_DN19512_c0_g1~~TRINITY_DN19512_c0_g1_i2.p1  ORF type:complete len:124 (+),score=8.39 TRINITY_DN19512_c0_g1_i2:203-574(+)